MFILQYCNYGIIVVIDVYVEVVLFEVLEVLVVDLLWIEVDGRLCFMVGDVGVYDCVFFFIQVLVDCDVELGMEVCVNVEIFLQSLCNLVIVDYLDIVC